MWLFLSLTFVRAVHQLSNRRLPVAWLPRVILLTFFVWVLFLATRFDLGQWTLDAMRGLAAREPPSAGCPCTDDLIKHSGQLGIDGRWQTLHSTTVDTEILG